MLFENEYEEASYYAAINRTNELLEYADRCLLGQVVEDGDPPDGVVVVVLLGCRNGCSEALTWDRDYEWRVYCGSCYDADCVGDPPRFVSNSVVGCGKDKVSAAEDWNYQTGELLASEYHPLLTVAAQVAA